MTPTRGGAVAVLKQILSGDLAPEDGARSLWEHWWSEHPDTFADLVTFVNDASDLDELPSRRQEIEDHIRSEAARVLVAWSGQGPR